MENRIKEQQLYLFADRTSTDEMHSNQLRLYFSSFAYLLVQAVRRLGLKGTAMVKKSEKHFTRTDFFDCNRFCESFFSRK